MTHSNVLYIASASRSGSTLLAHLLAQLPSATTAGELRYFPDRGLQEDWLCGCGRQFSQCAFWSKVTQRTLAHSPLRTQADILSASERVRTWYGLRRLNIPTFLFRRAADRARYVQHRFPQYLQYLAALYASVAHVATSRLIVDSSKDPFYAYVLAQVPSVSIRILHLVRDPRAVVYSRAKRRKNQITSASTTFTMDARVGITSAAWAWRKVNFTIERLFRQSSAYARIRYEDLTARPVETLREIATFAQLEMPHLNISTDNVLATGLTHMFSGNPSRLQAGPLTIRTDDAWRTALSPTTVRLINAVTSGYRTRYGYV